MADESDGIGMEIKQIIDECLELNGAIGVTELYAIYDLIMSEFKSTTNGIAIDLGSHRGRSSKPAAAALDHFKHLIPNFYMVDLLYDLTNPEWKTTIQGDASKIPWGYAKNNGFAYECFHNVQKNTRIPVHTIGMSSLEFLDKFKDKINYVFIDSDDHQPLLVLSEVVKIIPRVNVGGLVLFHDFNNQYHGPAEAYRTVLRSQSFKYEEVPINWEKIKGIIKSMNYLDDPNSWHWPHDRLYPTFIGCLRRVG